MAPCAIFQKNLPIKDQSTNFIYHPIYGTVLSRLRRRAEEDGSVPDCGARSLVEPRPFLVEHLIEVGSVDDRAKQLDEVRRMISLWDEGRLQWLTCTQHRSIATINNSVTNRLVAMVTAGRLSDQDLTALSTTLLHHTFRDKIYHT